MRIALIIVYYDQYAEWPFVLEGLKRQTTLPDQIIVTINHSKQKAPPTDGLKMDIVRTHKKYDAVYARGAALNTAVQHLDDDIDWVITTDADCILCSEFIEIYKMIFEGKIKTWSATVQQTGGMLRVAPDVDSTIFIGPRFWVQKPQELLNVGVTPEAAELLELGCSFDRHGYRCKPAGDAAVWGCNMAFPKHTLRKALFRNEGKHQDTQFYHTLRKGWDFISCPSPDNCYVLHMGPNFEGNYY